MKWGIYLASVIVACLYGIMARGELSFGGELILPVIVWVLMFAVKEEEHD